MLKLLCYTIDETRWRSVGKLFIMKTYVALIALILSCSTYAQTSSFKHDIGLKFSSYQPEKFQLQYRYHANEKWAFGVNGRFGTRATYYSNGDYLIQDSIYELFSTEYRVNSFGIDFNAIRKLSFMKHNFYYVGGSLGVGSTVRRTRDTRTVYEPMEMSPGQQWYGPPFIGEVIESETYVTLRNSMNFNSRLFVGLDVPIVDRLSFNFELGISLDAEVGNTDQFNYVSLSVPGYVAGGLRFNFGRIKE